MWTLAAVCAFSRTSCPRSLARRPTLRCSSRLCRRQAVLTLIPEGPQCSAADGGRCVACPSLLSFYRWGSGSVPCCAGVIHWPGAACGDAVARSRRAWRSRRSWARARAGPRGSGWNNFGCHVSWCLEGPRRSRGRVRLAPWLVLVSPWLGGSRVAAARVYCWAAFSRDGQSLQFFLYT